MGESRDEAGDAVRAGTDVGAGEGGNAVCSAGVGGWKVGIVLRVILSALTILRN